MILYLYIIAFTEKAVLLQKNIFLSFILKVGESSTFEIVTTVNVTAPVWYIVSNFIRILTHQVIRKTSSPAYFDIKNVNFSQKSKNKLLYFDYIT